MKLETLFNLYELYREESRNNINHHRETLQNYLAFSAAILGATIAGIIQIQNMRAITIFVLALPILNIMVCRLAINMCNRFYSAALECNSITAKLEMKLGIRKIDFNKAKVFPNDSELLPERWIENSRRYNTSAEFVSELSKQGINRIARQTFNILIGINLLLMMLIVLT